LSGGTFPLASGRSNPPHALAAMATVVAVRDEGRDHMRHMICSAFLPAGEEEAAAVADELAHFGMAGFDGAFVSTQSGDRRPMPEFTAELADAVAALGEARIAGLHAGS
jgi:hypothetical protein